MSSVPIVTMGQHVENGKRIAEYLGTQGYAVQQFFTEVGAMAAELPSIAEKPKALVIGGGFTDEEAAQATSAAQAFDAAVKVVRVTPGTIEAVGPGGVAKWVKEQLDLHNLSA